MRLDGERVTYGDIVRIVSEQWGCSERTVKNDIRWAYDQRKVALREEAAGNLTNGVDNAKREIRRLNILLAGTPDAETAQPTRSVDDASMFRYSMAKLRWEQHLLKLQGVLVGRLEVSVGQGVMVPICTVPAGPYGVDHAEPSHTNGNGGGGPILPPYLDPSDPRL
mgnify:CR=1 FL=1